MSKNNRLIRLLSSAGGGKTYRLSTRYKNLLRENNKNLKKSLAITFTNKAATEMKERILGLLKEEALEKKDKYARELIDYILDNYSDFSVRTIDSFVNALVKAFSIELRITPEAELIMDSDYYKDFAVNSLIQSVEEDKKLRERLRDFIVKRIETGGNVIWNFRRTLRDGMDRVENYENNKNVIFERPSEDLSEMDKDIVLNINKSLKMAEKILEYSETHAGIYSNLLKCLQKGLKNKDVNEIITRSYIHKECEESLKKDFKGNPSDFCRLFSALKNSVYKYYELNLLRDYNHEIGIYEKYTEILNDIRGKQKVRFIEDINKELKSLFKDFSVPFIFYRIGERFLHYLVDEFQDTSKNQWQNLVPLIDNALSEGGSFFYVGDPKQAIYQWRGGDVELFDVPQGLFASVSNNEKDSKYTDKNYRSAPGIIDFVGEVFSNLPNEVKIDMGDKKNFYERTVEQKVPENKKWEGFKGLVSLKKIQSESPAIDDIFTAINTRLEKTIEEILKRDYRKGDIAILVRRNKDAKKITEYLCEKGYPVVSNETLYLTSNPVIKGLLSTLKFLQHPIDNTSFLGFLISPFFLKKTNLKEEDIITFGENCNCDVPLYIQFRGKFPEIWEKYINTFFRNVGFLPVYDLISDIIRVFRIPENCAGCEAFIESFLEFVHNLEEKSVTSIEGMLLEWEKAQGSSDIPSILLPESAEAIKIMTIHSAKGLEFPVVIVPFTYIPSDKDKNEVVIEYKGVKRIVRIKSKNKQIILPEYNKELKREIEKKILEKKQDWTFEEINNLYVALTRAKYELHVFLPESRPGGSYNNLWKKVLTGYLDGDSYVYGKPQQKPAEEEKEEEIPLKYLKIKTKGKESVEKTASRLRMKKNKIKELMNKEIKESRKLGEILHKVLFYIKDTDDLENLDSIIARSLNEFTTPGEKEFFREKTKPIIKSIFEKEEIKKWFAPSLKVWREKEIVSDEGELYRFDRAVFNKNEIHIIDYKSGEQPSSKWRRQLENYKKILSEYFPDKKIKTYIINLNTREVLQIG
jgi:ATP-dependent helicase/nuclease subunit A